MRKTQNYRLKGRHFTAGGFPGLLSKAGITKEKQLQDIRTESFSPTKDTLKTPRGLRAAEEPRPTSKGAASHPGPVPDVSGCLTPNQLAAAEVSPWKGGVCSTHCNTHLQTLGKHCRADTSKGHPPCRFKIPAPQQTAKGTAPRSTSPKLLHGFLLRSVAQELHLMAHAGAGTQAHGPSSAAAQVPWRASSSTGSRSSSLGCGRPTWWLMHSPTAQSAGV